MQSSSAEALTADTPVETEVHRYRLLAASGLSCGALASGGNLPAICLVQIAATFQLTDAQSGFFFAIAPTITLVTLPIFGLLGEKWGKQSFLVASLLLLAVAMFAYQSATSYTHLLLGSVALGLSCSVIDALVSPLVVDLYPKRTAPAMNLIHCCFQTGIVATAILAGLYLAQGGDWHKTFLPLLILGIVLAIVLAITKFPAAVEHASPEGLVKLLINRDFWLCSVVIAMAGGVEAGILNWVSSFLQRAFDLEATSNWLSANYGLNDPAPLLGAMGLVLFAAPMVFGRWFYGSIAERIGYVRVLIISCTICAISLVGLWLASSASVSIFWLALLGLAISGVWPTLLILAGQTIPANPPTLFSILAMAGLAGVGICSWGVGIVAEFTGEIQNGLGALILPVIASIIALALLRNPPAALKNSATNEA